MNPGWWASGPCASWEVPGEAWAGANLWTRSWSPGTPWDPWWCRFTPQQLPPLAAASSTGVEFALLRLRWRRRYVATSLRRCPPSLHLLLPGPSQSSSSRSSPGQEASSLDPAARGSSLLPDLRLASADANANPRRNRTRRLLSVSDKTFRRSRV